MQMKILFLRRHSAADMPLGLVKIQHFPCLRRQRRINMNKAVRHIFMYGALAYPELPGGLPHRCFLLNNIPCYFHRTFLDIILQGLPPAMLVFTIYAEKGRGIQKKIRPSAFPLVHTLLVPFPLDNIVYFSRLQSFFIASMDFWFLLLYFHSIVQFIFDG